MSDIKTQMALRALNSLEDFARDAIIGKAQKESEETSVIPQRKERVQNIIKKS